MLFYITLSTIYFYINDLNGANQAGVNFIGVTYGFGFKPDEKYEFISIDYPKQLLAILK